MKKLQNSASAFQVRLNQVEAKFIATQLPRFYSLVTEQPLIVSKNKIQQKKNPIKFTKNSSQILLKSESSCQKTFSYSIYQKVVGKIKSHPFYTVLDEDFISQIKVETVQNNMKNNIYQHFAEIERDIVQMFSNAFKNYSKNMQNFCKTEQLQKYYNRVLKQIKKLPNSDQNLQQHTGSFVEQNTKIIEVQNDISNVIKLANLVPNNRKSYTKKTQKPLVNTQMTQKQKKQLSKQIKLLNDNQIQRALQIIQNVCKQTGASFKIDTTAERITLNLDKINNKALRQVQNYLRLVKKQKISIKEDTEEVSGDQSN